MNKKGILLIVTESGVYFIIFCVCMIFAELVHLLIVIGIAGLSGFSYFISKIISVGVA